MPGGNASGKGGRGSGMGRGRGGSGRGLGRGGGQGRRDGSGKELDNYCICPDCGEKTSLQMGKPCYEQKCPKCGKDMTREGV